MFIVTPTPDAQAKLLWERHEWHFVSHSPSVVGPSTRTHAAPLELGGRGGICGYKHAAPKGAFCLVALALAPGCRLKDVALRGPRIALAQIDSQDHQLLFFREVMLG